MSSSSKSTNEEPEEKPKGWYPGKFLGLKKGGGDDEGGAGTLDAFMGKFSSEHRQDLSGKHYT